MRIVYPLFLGVASVYAMASCSFRSESAHERFLEGIVAPALERFRADVGRYPYEREGLEALLRAPVSDSAQWHGPYLGCDRIPPDPWGRAYLYRSPSQKSEVSYDLICLGPDADPRYFVFSK